MHARSLNVTPSATCVRNQLIHLFLIQSWLELVSRSVKSLQLFHHLSPYRRLLLLYLRTSTTARLFVLAAQHRNVYFLITSYYISRLSVQFFFPKCLCSRFVPPSCTGWIIHLQADEKRAGKVRSAEVEWPWFLLAAGHPAVAVVIIHTSQMAFPWVSMKRTGQGLSCQVLPGPKTTLGQYGTWRDSAAACSRRKALQSQVRLKQSREFVQSEFWLL